MVVVKKKGTEIVLGEISLQGLETVADLKKAWQKKFPKYYPSRQRFEYNAAVLTDDSPLSKYSISEGSTLVFRDLGPQVGYKTVFLVEYAGPLVIYLLLATRFYPLYDQTQVQAHPLDQVQKLSLYCWAFHFVKRLLETLFVHKFSKGTMPVFNIYRNCAYYWSMGLLVGFFHNHPLYTSPSDSWVFVGLPIFVLSEIGNFITHVILSNLRPAGSTARKIPHGFLFEFVSCPNYFLEITSWIGFSIMTHSVPALIFTLIGATTMYGWAVERHIRYKKEFDGKNGQPLYPRRKVLIPFVL
eukprot:TRINITY_DN640_c0_g1_i1.p1 TRINITY_DN640_c0_g1~~TRINITY_DN640_c0_g1_i1.p1  ORF type:complete len:299 (-),score=84.58 TRINITY_DN640_c0_g1_i1:58-954(-)